MKPRGLTAATVALCLFPGALPAAAGPLYEISHDRTLLVSALPDVLERPEVRPHLLTGLTTSFMVTVSASDERGRRVRGVARIDVRWEPWDELFLVAVVSGDGRRHGEALPSTQRLHAWWRGLELPVATAVPPGSWQVKVELSVIPFSQSEQSDAQRWFSSAPGREAPADAEAAGGSRLNDVVDLLIATSIQRRSIVRYAWPASPRPAAGERKR